MNKKDKIQIAVTGVLAVILAVILALGMGKNGRNNKKRKPAARAGTTAAAAKSPAASPAVKLSPFRQLQAEAQSMPLVRDPFTLKPIEKEGDDAAQEVKFYLIGIAWDSGPGQPKAIINNKIVQVGSQLGGFTVIEILEDKVILSDGVEKLELSLEL
ncbi:MAG TPA: hypothetical protein PLB05_12210 [Candidatus Omnitrophota bacterium]|jgi:hypothetical protein|nr:hypothetical protein [Candidatus Omnitrophota bacterium]HPN57136.1 hypothetical protein [Candidatus Omnitrophota bacterium]